MNFDSFFRSLAGGALIGLSATLLLALHGRIAGISGIFYAALAPGVPSHERRWRFLFLFGLIVAGGALFALAPSHFGDQVQAMSSLGAAGFLVGLGTKMASGCTSGHGVCGLSRLSRRSMAATVVFLLSGMLTVFLGEKNL